MQESYGPAPPGRVMGVRSFQRPPQVVKWLLIINIVVFCLQVLIDSPKPDGFHLSDIFGVTVGAWWQVWRFVTFQFLHGGLWHIVLNMLGVYFLGSALEQRWGQKRFLGYYLSCGAAAGLSYVIIGAAVGPDHLPPDVPLIGASGGVYALILACAVFLPHFMLIFLFFPVPIRLAAVILLALILFPILIGFRAGQFSGEFWSQAAHLGGAAAGALWIWVLPRLLGGLGFSRERIRRGAWQRRMKSDADQQARINRILEKISEQGISSLTEAERKALQEATRKQQQQDRDLYRP